MTTRRYILVIVGLTLAPLAVALLGHVLQLPDALMMPVMVVVVTAAWAGAVAVGRRAR